MRSTLRQPSVAAITLSKAGYFGGAYYQTLTETYRMAINTMNSMGNSMASMGLLFDMMDMNAQY